MNSEARIFATKIAETLHGDDDRAWTTHHPGQMTVADYRRLDLVDPRSIHGAFRVRTGWSPTAFECVGLNDDGWLVRAELTSVDVAGLHRLPRILALFELPYLRLVDERTGFSYPGPQNSGTLHPQACQGDGRADAGFLSSTRIGARGRSGRDTTPPLLRCWRTSSAAVSAGAKHQPKVGA